MPVKPTIALVQGDAAGVGPELMTRLLDLDEVRGRANILVVSDARVFRAGREVTGLDTPIREIAAVEDADYAGGVPNLLDVPAVDPAETPRGKVSVAAGAAVLKWFGRALDLAVAGRVDGICFMPFNKQAMHKAAWTPRTSCSGPGCASDTAAEQASSTWSTACGTRGSPRTCRCARWPTASRWTVSCKPSSLRIGRCAPRVSGGRVSGWRGPHAGEGGAIGTEEIDVIEPAVREAQTRQIAVEGPFPSDTLYLRMRDRRFDCAVSMYHDQGQIAIKLLGFDRGVTVLGGLPVPIATPAHGTAYDIAGANTANLEPARHAFLTVCSMVKRRAGESSSTSRRG